jgi:3-deoxy-7-phosphoheptulonate synthase
MVFFLERNSTPKMNQDQVPTMKEHIRLASRESKEKSIIRIGDVAIGCDLAIIAGPCSIESPEQALTIARAVQAAGANLFRGGAFKPRSSPYSFQGLGLEGLKILEMVRKETGLPTVTEVLDPRDVSWVSEYVDLLQIGARNVQNFSLLKEVGRAGKPVILKRGMYSTLLEWLQSAEYILKEGNPRVVLCERGIRTVETYTRNTLDLSAVPALNELSHPPVVIDPTHGTGRPSLIPAMSLAAIAAGADGIMLEVHHNPEEALSDKDQALLPDQFARLVPKMKTLRSMIESWSGTED